MLNDIAFFCCCCTNDAPFSLRRLQLFDYGDARSCSCTMTFSFIRQFFSFSFFFFDDEGHVCQKRFLYKNSFVSLRHRKVEDKRGSLVHCLYNTKTTKKATSSLFENMWTASTHHMIIVIAYPQTNSNSTSNDTGDKSEHGFTFEWNHTRKMSDIPAESWDYTAAIFTLPTHSHCWQTHTAATFKLKPYSRCWNIHTAAAVTLLPRSHRCRVHTAAAFTPLPRSHRCRVHTAAAFTPLPHSHFCRIHTSAAFTLLILLCRACHSSGNFFIREVRWVRGPGSDRTPVSPVRTEPNEPQKRLGES